MPKSNPASQRWNALSPTRNSTVASRQQHLEDKPLHPNRTSKTLILITRLPAGILLGFVRLYQRLISPILPAVFGSACGCRFHPTCSHYAADALSRHGALRGSWLTLRRLIKCNPLHPGGLDPVPVPRCTRVASPHKTTLSHG